ncbi:hypothetical protein SAMN05216524_101125 [Mucilaginibacter sp. OK098]|nr:hypothetical protein SAMN05216524_101125 [Mucilaginibacter sp. OK098]
MLYMEVKMRLAPASITETDCEAAQVCLQDNALTGRLVNGSEEVKSKCLVFMVINFYPAFYCRKNALKTNLIRTSALILVAV